MPYFTAQANKKKTLVSIEWTEQPNVQYNTKFTEIDGTVTATYSDNSTKDVTNECEYSWDVVNGSTFGSENHHIKATYTEDDITVTCTSTTYCTYYSG